MKDDVISRQNAIDALSQEIIKRRLSNDINDGMLDEFDMEDILRKLPPSQPDGIPFEWIDKHLEWLDSIDSDFAEFSKLGIKTMVTKWKVDTKWKKDKT